jgi:ribose transport system ATP-binding protein
VEYRLVEVNQTVASPRPASQDGQRRDAALTVEHLSKTFGAERALIDLDLAIEPGHVHGLVGGNGSGKSTLVKILAGVHQGEQGGVIRVGGHEVAADATSPDFAMACGLRFVHQNPGLFPALTVAENIAIGSAGGFPSRMGRVRWRLMRERARTLLELYEIDADPDALLEDLSHADRTMVAIARALQDRDGSAPPTILVLDEPTASLPEHEVEILLAAIRRCARRGQTILYVSHRLEEVLSIIDAVTVLRDGELVITRGAEDLRKGELVEHMIGRPLERVFGESGASRPGSCVLEARSLAGGPLRDVSLDVRAGEIVGIAGLLGSGRTELLRLLFGAYPRADGAMTLNGACYDPSSPAAAIAAGVAYVPENREADAAFLDLSVQMNLSVAEIDAYRQGIRLRKGAERVAADRAIERFSIRTAGREALLASVSGGNQQKVVVARWLQRSPKLLLLDEPTQGVDIGARADLHAAIRAATSAGMASILVTSDMEELAHASDRVLVLREGRIVAEASGDDLNEHHLTSLLYADEDQ